jgi:uncharacterized cupin superfamily protein
MVKHPNVFNEDNLNWVEQSHDEKFALRRKLLSTATGGVKLGCSLYEIPPGKKAWPYHYHTANEEAIYILEGKGTLRIGDKEIQISKGDYITCPAGKEGHQVINSSDKELRYLCFSTMIEPDVIVYPDSNKVGVFVGAAPGGPKEKRTLHKYLRGDAEIDYWDGEE